MLVISYCCVRNSLLGSAVVSKKNAFDFEQIIKMPGKDFRETYLKCWMGGEYGVLGFHDFRYFSENKFGVSILLNGKRDFDFITVKMRLKRGNDKAHWKCFSEIIIYSGHEKTPRVEKKFCIPKSVVKEFLEHYESMGFKKEDYFVKHWM